MKRKIPIIIFFAVVILATILFIKHRGVKQAPAPDRIALSLRLPIPAADTAFSPYYLAIDKGFFAKHGLEVKLEPGTPELNPVKMVAQGKDQFGVVGGPELLMTGRAKGAPLVGIALLHKDSDFVVIVALKSSGITRLDELNGKKVGFFYGHISTDVLHMLLRKENIHVEEVDVGFDYGQLLAKRIQAQWAFRTTAGISLPARGVELNVISPAKYGIITQGHLLITNEEMIRDHSDIVQRFVDAVLDATAYSVEHVPEAIEATIRRDPNFNSTVGEKQMEIYKAAILRNSKIGWIADSDMDKTKQQLESVELLPPSFDLKQSYVVQFVAQHYSH